MKIYIFFVFADKYLMHWYVWSSSRRNMKSKACIWVKYLFDNAATFMKNNSPKQLAQKESDMNKDSMRWSTCKKILQLQDTVIIRGEWRHMHLPKRTKPVYRTEKFHFSFQSPGFDGHLRLLSRFHRTSEATDGFLSINRTTIRLDKAYDRSSRSKPCGSTECSGSCCLTLVGPGRGECYSAIRGHGKYFVENDRRERATFQTKAVSSYIVKGNVQA